MIAKQLSLFPLAYHHPQGNLCLGILKTEAWKPSTQVKILLEGICQLLEEPNPDDPLGRHLISFSDTDAADLYVNDRKKFEEKAKEYVKKYCK
jgi:ubiquitin-conjugating enzyme E2 D/E